MSLVLVCLWIFGIAALVNQVSVALTTVYLHRGKNHLAVRFLPWVDNLMSLTVLFLTGVVTREWVAWHRNHHAHPDQKGDSHSPYEHGLWPLFWYKNFLLYRRDTRDMTFVWQNTRGWKLTWADRLPFRRFGIVIGLGIVVVVSFLVWGIWGILFGFLAFLLHVLAYIWLNAAINSFCHMKGYQNYKGNNNLATNIRWLAWLTAGEALHNNHHGNQNSPKFSHRKEETDLGWGLILGLSFLGLAEPRWELIQQLT